MTRHEHGDFERRIERLELAEPRNASGFVAVSNGLVSLPVDVPVSDDDPVLAVAVARPLKADLRLSRSVRCVVLGVRACDEE